MSSPADDKENKSEDKKDIELEEREKMLNAENKAQDKISELESAQPSESENEGSKLKTDFKEGREVKPKKIPIGGIQMPGFFTRSKSKEKCKDGDSDHQGDVEGTELLEQNDKEKADDSLMNQARVKLPNPFRKSKVIDEDVEKGAEAKGKKTIVDRICLPIVSVFPKKKKDGEQNIENQQAGLASMETLEDNDKSADNKNDGLKNVPLDDKKSSDKPEAEEPTWKQKLKAYRIVISALLVFLLLLIIIIAVAIPGNKENVSAVTNGNRVDAVTSCGKVEGLLHDGAVAFRGIPYARPPIDDLRFKAAQPLNNISYCWNGTFLAHNATDLCMQIHSNGSITGSEDCLTLDVVTPYVRYYSPLPVIVLIGAESFLGGSPGKMRPSARYARSRDVIFVRPNFRLGVLGFLALDVLSQADYPHTSGNYALSDIIQALKWVKLNIEHFGGNPEAVTLFGHRAGATLVTALATTRNAQKLFARAWATSGGALYPQKSLSESEKENESFLSSVQCQDVDCLRTMDPVTLTKSVEDTWRKPQPDLPSKDEKPEERHKWMVLDGKILQENPATIWADEAGLPVKLVLGTTAHAAATEKLLLKYNEWTEDLVTRHVKSSMLSELGFADETLNLYPKTYKGLTTMVSDIRTVCPLFAIHAQMRNSSFYVVTQTRGEQDLADIDSDVDAILGRYEPKTPEQKRYFSAIQQLFYHYVWHGKIEELYGPGNKVLVVGQDVLPDASYSHCGMWINSNVVLTYAQLD